MPLFQWFSQWQALNPIEKAGSYKFPPAGYWIAHKIEIDDRDYL